MYRLNISIILLLGFLQAALAQRQELNNTFFFKDGIYLSRHEFAGDSPSLKLSDIIIEELDGSDFNFKILMFTFSEDSVFLESQIWGLSINGTPYINYENKSGFIESQKLAKNRFVYGFSRIQTIGSICFFATAKLFAGTTNVGAMFGIAGAIISHKIKRKYDVGKFKMKILNLSDGRILDFTHENLVKFIAHDPQLTTQLMSAKKPQEQMYRTLKQYNERYPVYLD